MIDYSFLYLKQLNQLTQSLPNSKVLLASLSESLNTQEIRNLICQNMNSMNEIQKVVSTIPSALYKIPKLDVINLQKQLSSFTEITSQIQSIQLDPLRKLIISLNQQDFSELLKSVHEFSPSDLSFPQDPDETTSYEVQNDSDQVNQSNGINEGINSEDPLFTKRKIIESLIYGFLLPAFYAYIAKQISYDTLLKVIESITTLLNELFKFKQ